MFRALCLLCSITAVTLTAVAQPSSIGIKGGYLYVMNTSTLPIVAGSTDCGAFADGVANGMYAGITGEYALIGDALELAGGITYTSRPAALTAVSRDNFEVLDPRSNIFVPLERSHRFEANLGYVAIEAGLRIRPLAWLPVYVRLGADAGNPVVGATYRQTEQITAPDGILFPDGRSTRVNADGELTTAGTSYGASFTLGGVLRWLEHVEVCPEIGYRYNLNNLVSDNVWRQSYAMAGIQVRYRIVGGEEPPPPPMPEPEPKPEPPPIVEVPAAPTERPVVITSLSTSPLEINETVVTQTFPLLPYLFFDAGKADLRARYRSDEPTQGFSEQTLPKQTLPIYYRMLDIIGKRMQRQPGTVLTVTGTADETEAYADADLRQLATRRARAVVDYMRDRWSLPEDRFRVTTADQPSLPSNEAYAEGLEENRRVEITASDASLLAPVVHSRFLEFVSTQPMHEFTVATRNPELATSWDLEVRRGGTLVGWKRGTGAPPNVRFDLTQEITDRLGPVIEPVDTLDATIIVQQANAAPVQATTRFPLRKTVSNFEVSRLSLIVFDYDQATISPVNQQMMRYVIMQSAGQGSTASIKGSTDRLGELRYNVNLSTDRARAVEAYLRSVAPQVSIDSVTGVGPADLPYDNSLPEGRFYCRTVSLTITTPLR